MHITLAPNGFVEQETVKILPRLDDVARDLNELATTIDSNTCGVAVVVDSMGRLIAYLEPFEPMALWWVTDQMFDSLTAPRNEVDPIVLVGVELWRRGAMSDLVPAEDFRAKRR